MKEGFGKYRYGQPKKFKMVFWGMKDKISGMVLIGHDTKPIFEHKRSEIKKQCGKDCRPVKLTISE
jgi:hypothetical protein